MTPNDQAMKSITPYPEIDQLLSFFTSRIASIFRTNLKGIYLTGSLSYNAFNYNSSDIDITVMLNRPISTEELKAIAQFHQQLEHKFKVWSKRLECTYTPVDMFSRIKPPSQPRPWYWGGENKLYLEATYGNEWIINNYLLHHHAISLFGPDFKTLMEPVDIAEVQKACIRNLFTEWVSKKNDPDYFSNSHYTAYFILNLCRILYTVICKQVGDKPTASSWVKGSFDNQWKDLIHQAQAWKYGVELDLHNEALQFLDFVIVQVSQTQLFKQLELDLQLNTQ